MAISRRTFERKNNIHRNRAAGPCDITPAYLERIFKRTKQCPLCGVSMVQHSTNHPPANQKTLDHIIPLGGGGTHTRANVRVVCKRCNENRTKESEDNK